MNSSKERGFTLIELLVVVAIIGILATVVLASLSGARDRANVAKVKAQMAQIGAAMTTYLDANAAPGAAVATCTGPFADPTSGMQKLTTAASYPGNPTITCNYQTSGNWAVLLVRNTVNYCIDNTVNSYTVTEGGTPTVTDGDCD
jgi:prepilin-type N-terminal cleavage/methylation domain-containing protein